MEKLETVLECPRKRMKLGAELKCNPFDRLPDEIVEMILDLAKAPGDPPVKQPGHSSKSMRLVCQRWNMISTPLFRFGGVLRSSTIDSFVQLGPEIKLKSLVLCDLRRNHVRGMPHALESQDSDLTFYTRKKDVGRNYDSHLFERSVEHLIVGGDAGTFLGRHRSKVETELPYSLSTGFAEHHVRLTNVFKSITGSDLEAIMERVKDVKILTFTSVAFLSVCTTRLNAINFTQQFSTLSTLDLCVGRKTELFKLGVFLKRAIFPTLVRLYIRVYAVGFHFSLYTNLIRFISQHPLLKSLSLSQAQVYYGLPENEINESCFPKLRVAEYPALMENLLKIRLDYLRMDCLMMNHEMGDSWKKLEFAFIKSQTRLCGLELHLTHQEGLWDKILPACEKTLERLEFTASDFSQNQFDCSALTRFTKMQECHLYLRNSSALDRETPGQVTILNLHRLPESITSLHLSRLPTHFELNILKDRLIHLKRVSYSCSDMTVRMTPIVFVQILQQHLAFPQLVDFRMYTYACPTVTSLLHCQFGLVAYIEDCCVVVLVDREELNLDALRCRADTISSECFCLTCTRQKAIWNYE